MKKFLAIMAAALALVLAACDNGDSTDNENGSENNNNNTGNGSTNTSLTIKNTSDYDFSNVVYGTTTFGAINSGTSQTKGVTASSSKPISFFLNLNYIYEGYGVRCETAALACDEGKNREITISNNTTVTAENKDSDTLENIAYMMEAETGKH